MKDKKGNLILPLFLSLSVILLAIIFCGSSLAISYQHKFYPQTFVSGVDLSGRTKIEAESLLEEKDKAYADKEIVINYVGRETKITPAQINSSFNPQADLDQLFAETHPNFFASIFISLENQILGREINQAANIDETKATEIINQLAQDNFQAPQDASLEIADNSIVFSEAKSGEGPDLKIALETVKDQISSLKTAKISLNKTKLDPAISDVNLAQAYFKVSNLLQNKGFDLKKGSNTIYRVNSRDLKNWLKFEKKTYANFEDTGLFKGRVAGISISTKDESGVFVLPQLVRNKNTLEAYIDTNKVNNFILMLAAKIDEEPQDAKLAIVNNAVSVVEKESYGRELDQKKLFEEINLRLNSSSENDIQLSVVTLTPEVRSNNISELGIKEKIAVGESSFAGSPKNRINNLTIGTSKFNGAIVKPDEAASFAKIVGDVDESQGYLPELVIKGTETIQELGGGMCQVSTTFYRAALNAGVPIIERHAHAYLVGYYKDGPDATVYVPSTDLKWKNDTGHYILLQTSVDPAKKKVTFTLWGTNDGRKIAVSAPTYTDIVPAPTDPYYVDDPTYPIGYLVEEEHPHEGATGTIVRTITYPAGKTKTDTIKSTYKPWPAKMRRGTGPVDLPIPTPNP